MCCQKKRVIGKLTRTESYLKTQCLNKTNFQFIRAKVFAETQNCWKITVLSEFAKNILFAVVKVFEFSPLVRGRCSVELASPQKNVWFSTTALHRSVYISGQMM